MQDSFSQMIMMILKSFYLKHLHNILHYTNKVHNSELGTIKTWYKIKSMTKSNSCKTRIYSINENQTQNKVVLK